MALLTDKVRGKFRYKGARVREGQTKKIWDYVFDGS
jgi:hypothetical protein